MTSSAWECVDMTGCHSFPSATALTRSPLNTDIAYSSQSTQKITCLVRHSLCLASTVEVFLTAWTRPRPTSSIPLSHGSINGPDNLDALWTIRCRSATSDEHPIAHRPSGDANRRLINQSGWPRPASGSTRIRRRNKNAFVRLEQLKSIVVALQTDMQSPINYGLLMSAFFDDWGNGGKWHTYGMVNWDLLR